MQEGGASRWVYSCWILLLMSANVLVKKTENVYASSISLVSDGSLVHLTYVLPCWPDQIAHSGLCHHLPM